MINRLVSVAAMTMVVSIGFTANIYAAAADVVCDKCIGSTDIAGGAVNASKIGKNAVVTAKIKGGAVTEAKLSAAVRAKLSNSSCASAELYLFSSDTMVDGGAGRVNMNNICRAQDAAASFCSEDRMIYSNKFGLIFASGFAGGFVDFDVLSSPCQDWSVPSDLAVARSMDANGGITFDTYCSEVLPIVCCK